EWLMRVISRFDARFGSGRVPVVDGVGALDIGLVRLGEGEKRPTGLPVRLSGHSSVRCGSYRQSASKARRARVSSQAPTASGRGYSPTKGSMRWGTRKVW